MDGGLIWPPPYLFSSGVSSRLMGESSSPSFFPHWDNALTMMIITLLFTYNSTWRTDMKIKNIETDGEMTVFATAGHNGVLVCDVDQFAHASAKGILPCDVIVGLGDKEINSLSDLDGITRDEFLSSKITIWRAPLRIVLK